MVVWAQMDQGEDVYEVVLVDQDSVFHTQHKTSQTAVISGFGLLSVCFAPVI